MDTRKYGKIGFINVCDVDYIIPEVQNFVDTAVKNLKDKGLEVILLNESITSEIDAETKIPVFLHNDLDAVIIFLGAWAQCPEAVAVVREIEHLPFCLWSIPMYEDELGRLEGTCAYVSYAMIKGSLDRMGYRYKGVIGMPDDQNALKEVQIFCETAITIQKLKRTRIGMVGGFSVGIWPATYDHVFMKKIIGPNIHPFDSYTVIRKAEEISETETNLTIDMLRSITRIDPKVKEADLIKISRLALALKAICDEYSLHAITVKCQYEFSKQYKMIMCVPLAILAQQGIIAACESDIPCMVSMIILNYLSGTTSAYGDAFNNVGNLLKLSPCGFAPFSMVDPRKRLIAPQDRFSGFNGINCRNVFKPGKITFMRLVEDCGTYHIVYGTGVGIETELRQTCMPALDVKLDGDVNKLIETFAGQHYAFCYGDITKKLEELARFMNISTIKV